MVIITTPSILLPAGLHESPARPYSPRHSRVSRRDAWHGPGLPCPPGLVGGWVGLWPWDGARGWRCVKRPRRPPGDSKEVVESRAACSGDGSLQRARLLISRGSLGSGLRIWWRWSKCQLEEATKEAITGARAGDRRRPRFFASGGSPRSRSTRDASTLACSVPTTLNGSMHTIMMYGTNSHRCSRGNHRQGRGSKGRPGPAGS